MPGVLPLQPFPVFEDPNQNSVHSNATVVASGSTVLTGYGASEVSLFINVKAAPTGAAPTLQYTIQEVDPGDGTTVIGNTATSTVISAIGIQRITLESTFGGSIKVSWVIGGAGPSFTQVYSTLVAKQGSAKITDGTSTASVKAASTAPVATDQALVVSVSPNSVLTAVNPSVGTNAAAIPTSSTQVGGSDGTNLQAARVFDVDSGAGTQYALGISLRKTASGGSVELGTGADPVRIDPTGTTAQPVTDNAGSLTVDTPQLPAALVGGRLDSNVGAWFGATTPTVGQKAMAASIPVAIASDQTVIPVSDNAGSLTVDTPQLPAALVGGRLDANVGAWFGATTPTVGQKTMAASIPVTLASDQTTINFAGTKSNNAVVPGATNLGVLPALANAATPSWTEGNQVVLSTLLTGALRSDVSSWFGSTAPTVGQKVMASSIPVTFASNQTPLSVTFATVGARAGVSSARLVLGGATAGTKNVMRATAYTEPAAAAQRSLGSSSASDTAAGVGARTVRITYFDNTGAGPFTEIVTLNGVTPVNTVATTIRFIEKMEVVTAGSTLVNVGTITLFGAAAGAGGTVGTIGIGNIVAAVGDNTTLWAHHYCPVLYTCKLSVLVVSAQSGGSGTNGLFYTTSIKPLVANATEVLIGDTLLVQGSFQRTFSFNPSETGFVRFTTYGIPGTNNSTLTAAFDWSETLT